MSSWLSIKSERVLVFACSPSVSNLRPSMYFSMCFPTWSDIVDGSVEMCRCFSSGASAFLMSERRSNESPGVFASYLSAVEMQIEVVRYGARLAMQWRACTRRYARSLYVTSRTADWATKEDESRIDLTLSRTPRIRSQPTAEVSA